MFNEILQSTMAFISNPYVVIIFLTLLPFLELRASIPYGILATDIPWFQVFLLASITNIILGPLLYFFVDKIIHIFFFIKPFERWYHKKLEKMQKKAEPMIKRYGILGLALFIAIPLPGSGVYSGSLIAYIFNLGHKRFLIATIIGILIAAIAVTAITLTVDAGTMAARLFLKTV
ncbi:small multi-drug export protein [Candidatus Woesearchaeota archaeon]|nr:small multi-drug export protein [Candidatus Woesearchaeota archaeon]